jgi:putative ABC transport system substrate-binding protein
MREFFEELQRLGFSDATLEVQTHTADVSSERRAEIVRQVVHAKPDIILVVTGPLAREVAGATNAMPVVSFTSDPIAFGHTTSFARPSANVTGIAIGTGAEIWGKRLQLLRELLPTARKIGFLARKDVWEGSETPEIGRAIRSAAKVVGVDLSGISVEAPSQRAEYIRAFDALRSDSVDALVVQDTAENFSHHELIVKLIEKAGVPAIYPFREFSAAGGLMTYAADLIELFRHAGRQVDKILRGGAVADIPFFQAGRFELILNMKTAKGMGLTVPATLLARADELIE